MERQGEERRGEERRGEERSREDGGMFFIYGFPDEVNSAPGFLNSGPDWSFFLTVSRAISARN